jgi:formate-dependent nitrite reductase membrane component NrfD
MNPGIDPHLEAWGWEVSLYLFLGGLVAGMMILAGFYYLRDGKERMPFAALLSPILSLVLISVGMFFLFLDLGYKWHVWRFYTAFKISSPMSWGSWCLLFVYPVNALFGLALLAEPLSFLFQRMRTVHEKVAPYARFLAGASIASGIFLGIYTGILLSSLVARPLWNSAALGPIFLVSGLSSAAAFLYLLSFEHDEKRSLASADLVFLGTEALFIALFLIGLSQGSEVARKGADLLLGGPFAATFWVLVGFVGIVIPWVLERMELKGRIQATWVPALFVLAGGISLRFIIVQAGQFSGWR